MSEERESNGQIDWADKWAANYKKDLEFEERKLGTMKRMLTVLGEETRQILRSELIARISGKGRDVKGK